jgi:transposase InsO family protein
MVVMDELTRRCLAIHTARSIRAREELEIFAELMVRHGVPDYMRSDNVPEMVAEELRTWLQQMGSKTAYITPGSPWENGYCESINSSLRDELLSGEIFYTLKEAQVVAYLECAKCELPKFAFLHLDKVPKNITYSL